MKSNFSFKITLIFIFIYFVNLSYGQVSIGTLGSPILQDFNTLGLSGTSSVMPIGWVFTEVGANSNLTYTASTGSANGGDTYSFGAAASTDRALGGLQSGSLNPTFGASFVNNTGSTITSLLLAYRGEQWRIGALSRVDRLDFQYSLDATSLTTGTWVDVNALDFTAPITTPVGALNGNANFTNISSSILSLAIADGQSIWIRFTDFNATSSDDGLGVDDFSLTANGVGGGLPSLAIGNISIVEGNTGTTSALFTVKLNNPTVGMGDVTFNYATANGTTSPATEPTDYTNTNGTGTILFSSGATTTTISVPIIGDLASELDETFFLNITMPSAGVTITVAQGLGTIQNDDLTPIHSIQGSGANSPIVGQTITTKGIVTGIKNNGFFIQEPDALADADPLTSEGILVFTGSTPPASVVIGNLLQVTGSVLEFIPASDLGSPPVTEIVSPTLILLSTGNPLPTAISLTSTFPNPTGVHDQLERIEGMLGSVASLTVVAPTGSFVSEPNATATSNGVLYGVVTGIPRPFREAGIQSPDTPPAGSIPPIPRFDGNPELIRVDTDSQAGTTAINVSTGAVLTNVVGPIDYSFRSYTILPGTTTVPVVSQQGITQAIPKADAGTNQFTVASYNMERFFDTVNDASVSDVALTPTAFAARLNKASLAIRNVLKTPDILAVVEMENLTTLQTLATKINADAVANGNPDPLYQAYLVEGNDVGGIDVGFLLKNTISVTSVTQLNKTSTFVDPSDMSVDLLNDRPALQLVAEVVHSPSGKTFPITVIVNHLRSLNGASAADASGLRIREKRKKQGEELANHVQARQVANPDEKIILVGDFNAFEFNDGLVDIINTILGTPTPDNETAVTGDGADLVTPNLVIPTLPAGSYSYSFNGNAQFLDHPIITQNLTSFLDKVEYVKLNADFAGTIRGDATRPERLSDHDPLVATFNFCPPVASLVPTLLASSAATICEGNSITLSGTCPVGYIVNWYDASSASSSIGSGASLNLIPTATKTYYASCKDVLCESDRVLVGTVTFEPLVLTPIANNFTQDISINTIVADCNLLAKVVPAGANPIVGQVKASVFFDTFSADYPFVSRHYEILPVPYNASNTLSSTITLYFTQAEFTAYNANVVVASPTTLLPLNSADLENHKANLRISKYTGTSPNGLPSSSYTNPQEITPTSIIWVNSNDIEGGRWEVTFTTVGFSGFFAHTGLINPLLTLSVGSTVFTDTNNNGMQNVGELGIVGAMVNLYKADGTTLVATTTTGIDGKYIFTGQSKGSYIVGVTPVGPETVSSDDIATTTGDNQTDGDDNGVQIVAGSEAKSAPISLIAGAEPTDASGTESSSNGELDNAYDADGDMTVDFGFFVPAKLSNLVFQDLNRDGINDTGEPGIGGVTVRLYDGEGNLVHTTITDPNGEYIFENLRPGIPYTVKFTVPAGYSVSPTNVGDDATDSDGGVPVGGISATEAYILISGDNNTTVDLGLYRTAALPLNLISFVAERASTQVNLTWKTANEVDFSHYEVQRSTNAKEFNAIGKVNGSNDKFYTLADTKPVVGNNYYRLKMVDKNGTYTVSKIQAVNFEASNEFLTVENNPVTNGVINLTTNVENAKFNLASINGTNVGITTTHMGGDKYIVKVKNAAAGVYLINVTGDKSAITKKVILD